MTRVLHLSRNAHPFIGGTENFVGSLVRHTAPLGVESLILCSTRRPSGAGPDPEAPTLRAQTVGPERFQLLRRAGADIRALVDWADVVHFHDLRFGLDLIPRVAELRRRPRVMSTHGLVFHTREYAAIKRVAWAVVIEPTLRSFDAVVADSAADFTRVRGLRQARLIPNPVDIDSFLTVAAVPRRPDGPLLSFGRLAPNKGLDRLASVLARTGARLEVVGTGDPSYIAHLRVAFADLPVEFRGSVDTPTLLDALARCSAVVLPSRSEGFGLTLVEAMASGRPVLASDIAPFREIAAESEVRLVDFDDADAVSAALSAVADDPHREVSIARARTFSWETRAPEFVALYRELTEAIPHRIDA